MPRTILLAPDKFKGSLSAPEVARHLAEGIAGSGHPSPTVLLPVADGGDGFRAAAEAAGFTAVPVPTVGPSGSPLESGYAVRDGVAVVELAEASGLARLSEYCLDPLGASSYGTGLVVRAALQAGCRTVLVGLGGSACTDGGAGLLEALGARYVVDDGTPTDRRGGGALTHIAGIDLTGLTHTVGGAEIILASDVDNPLLGPHGAAALYGPQKGAGRDHVALLESGLRQWADLVDRATGTDRRDEPGAGAAGGVGYGLMAATAAITRPGIDIVLDLVGFDHALSDARLVVTGEGALDAQTLHGKAVAGVAARAHTASVPVLAVTGRCDLQPEQLRTAGIVGTYTLTDVEPDLDACFEKPGPLLKRLGGQIAAEWRPDPPPDRRPEPGAS